VGFLVANPQPVSLFPSIVDKASLKPTDVVLEVGPGTGNLTTRILDKCKRCTAVEMDPRMAAELTKRVQGRSVMRRSGVSDLKRRRPEQKRLDLVVGDFLQTDLDYFDVCISNTPYQVCREHWPALLSRRAQISSPLVFKLLSQRPLFRVAILMFQQEFAQRLVARPGDKMWCRLSANVQLYAKVDHVLKVGRNNFRPPPQVDSSVVRIAPIDPPPLVRFEEFDGLTRILFNRRNKTVHANFQARGVVEMLSGNWVRLPDVEDEVDVQGAVERVLHESGFAQQRAAKMDINDFCEWDPWWHSPLTWGSVAAQLLQQDRNALLVMQAVVGAQSRLFRSCSTWGCA
jgi:18S rRNA (adenine1779-N6/adenine1780-N6)-dimethyltransferase